MKAMKSVCIYIFCLSFFASAAKTDIVTLVFPYGARSYGMGEVGTALADDESALFWNPAGLGITNPRWQSGAISQFYEPLLPALGLRELWHSAEVFNYELPRYWGALSLFHNFVNTGSNSFSDASGAFSYEKNTFEQVFALGWGIGFAALGDTTDFAGVSFKYIDSEMSRLRKESVAFDAGYIKKFKRGLRLGVTLQNMGPAIRYNSISMHIPLVLNLASGSKHEISKENMNALDIAWEVRLSKEFYQADGMRNLELNTGFELGVFNTGYIRQGYLIDQYNDHYEMHWGTGIRLFNHFNFDFGMIVSPEGFMKGFDPQKEGSTGVRNHQWQTSLSFVRIGSWSERDKRWWEVSR